MEWQDTGLVLSARPHGESAAVLELFTPAHGRHAGVVRGGQGRRLAPHLQPGGELAVRWRARLPEHLGSFTVEPLRSRAALTEDRERLAALNAITALLSLALPERVPHPELHRRTVALLDLIGTAGTGSGGWPEAYLHWELALLGELGFGLDLSACAVSGATQDLAYVSPRSGRAVSRAAAGDWAGRLLPLPRALLGLSGDAGEVALGLRTTGHFLHRHLAEGMLHRPLPAARARLLELLQRLAAAGGPPPAR